MSMRLKDAPPLSRKGKIADPDYVLEDLREVDYLERFNIGVFYFLAAAFDTKWQIDMNAYDSYLLIPETKEPFFIELDERADLVYLYMLADERETEFGKKVAAAVKKYCRLVDKKFNHDVDDDNF